MKTRNKYIQIIFVVIIIIIAYFVMNKQYQAIDKASNVNQSTGSSKEVESTVKIGSDFDLTNQYGKRFTQDNLKGKISLLYFGFSYCPDICVTALQKIDDVMKIMDKYNIQVNPVFITLDPARDDKDTLAKYFKNLHPKFIALTGTEEDITNVANGYKVYYSVVDPESKEYTLNHSSLIYYLNKNGEFEKHFTLDTSPEEIIQYIRINH